MRLSNVSETPTALTRAARTRRLLGSLLVVAVAAAGCATSDGADGASGGESAATGPACEGHRTATPQKWVEPITPEPEPELPVTLTDASGSEVVVEDADRILAVDQYGTLGATVYALGLGDRLVGRDISTGIPALQDLPLVTQGGHNLSAEAILNLNPSIILTDYSIGPYEVQLQLIDAGIPVVFMEETRSADTITEQIRAVANALGVTERGEELATRVEAEIDDAKAELTRLHDEAAGRDIRMVFLYLRGNAGIFYWFGEGSGADDIIASLHGVDVSKEVDVDGYTPINAEGLIKANPDMFLLMTGGLKSVGGVDGLADIAGVAETSAGLNQCVVDMADTQILSFGPQYPSTLLALGEAVYGDNGAASEQSS